MFRDTLLFGGNIPNGREHDGGGILSSPPRKLRKEPNAKLRNAKLRIDMGSIIDAITKNTQGNLIRLAGTNGCPRILVRPGPRLVTVHASATFPGGAVGSRS